MVPHGWRERCSLRMQSGGPVPLHGATADGHIASLAPGLVSYTKVGSRGREPVAVWQDRSLEHSPYGTDW